MTTVVATLAVGDMDTWLGGGASRTALFAGFCSSYRTFRHREKDRVSIVWEDVDLDRMKTALASPEAQASKTRNTVIDPVEIYIEIEGGS